MTCITTQADYNNREVRTGWTTLEKLQDEKIEGTITVGQILDLASTENGVVKKLRTQEITVYKPEWLKESFSRLLNTADLPKEVNEAMEGMVEEAMTEVAGTEPVKLNIGEMIDLLIEASESSKIRDKSITYSFTVGDILDCFDRKQLEEYVVSATTKAMYNPDYERTTERVVDCWMTMIGFSLLYAALATISLEFIDKDKR